MSAVDPEREYSEWPPFDDDPKHSAIMEALVRRIVLVVADTLANGIVVELGERLKQQKNINLDALARLRVLEAAVEKLRADFGKRLNDVRERADKQFETIHHDVGLMLKEIRDKQS
jgi:hypothetical protein